jgi:Rad3-related DNA helicase
MPGILAGITPSDIGLPPKFARWRDHQVRAIEASLDAGTRFVAQSLPTGSGKSAIYMAEALITGGRTVILTATKGLQDQLVSDFGLCGLVSVKGRNTFDCGSRAGLTCEDGPLYGCREGSRNSDKPPTCPYMVQYLEGLKSQIVVTNYSYWSAINFFGEGLGAVDLLICDEAHDAPEIVTSTVSCVITPRDLDLLRTGPPRTYYIINQWTRWALSHVQRCEQQIECYQEDLRSGTASVDVVRRVKALRNLLGKLKRLSSIKGHWLAETVPDEVDRRKTAYRLSPLWAKLYAEEVLWNKVPKIVLVSATLLPKTMDLLGVPPSELTFRDHPYSFPASRSPIYHIPTVRSNYKNREKAMNLQLEKIDQIIGSRLDRKGIIHTTSYQRAHEVIARSAYRDYMISHTPVRGEAVDAAASFRLSEAPAILVTPSMGTGYDFPYQQCEYQIILKAPYPDHSSGLVRVRVEEDGNYSHYLMAQELVQMCGRGMRAENDRCETFILDDTVDRIIRWRPGLFPPWFRQLYRKRENVPSPPPPLLTEMGVPF